MTSGLHRPSSRNRLVAAAKSGYNHFRRISHRRTATKPAHGSGSLRRRRHEYAAKREISPCVPIRNSPHSDGGRGVRTWIFLSPSRPSIVAQERGKETQKGPTVDELKKELLAAVRSAARLETARFQSGQGSAEDVLASTRMLANAELEACNSDKERVAALEMILATARETEMAATRVAKTGQGREGTALRAKAERLRFEIALERARSRAAARPTEGKASQELRDQAALAEKQAAVKRAAVKVVEAEKTRAEAGLAAIQSPGRSGQGRRIVFGAPVAAIR